jgi:hypothetical protein
MSRNRRTSTVKRRVAAIAGFSLIVTCFSVLPSSAAAEDSAPTAPSPDAPPATPTVLSELTTETTLVKAMPDGTFELTANREAVRTEKDGEWVDIDTTIQPASDGMVAARATTVDVSFSGGGPDKPLVRMHGEDGATLETWWEEPLPEPILNGDTATYPSVRDGVDLVLTAEPTGFGQSLVIHDESAARALIDAPAQLTAAGEDLSFDTLPDGHVVARDEDGIAFTSAPAVMWDSNTVPGTTEPDASDSSDSIIRPVDTTFDVIEGGIDITLAPPAAELDDTSLEYPLYLDPIITENRSNYLTVHSNGWNYSNSPDQPMRVGYCDWAGCNRSLQGNARSYFGFNIEDVVTQWRNTEVYAAAVRVKQVHSAASGQAVVLHKSDQFKLEEGWPGPSKAALESITSNGGFNDGPAATLTFDNEAVRTYVQNEANNGDGNGIRFALLAPSLNNKYQWKKFDNNPELTIRYGIPPSTPTDLNVAPLIRCPRAGSTIPVTSSATPKLYARSHERSGRNLPLNFFFQVANSAGTVVLSSGAVPKASDALAEWTPPALPTGTFKYRAMAKVNDPHVSNAESAWSGWMSFEVDLDEPGNPTMSTYDYPPAYWGVAQNGTGEISLSGSVDTAGFTYTIDGGVVPTLSTVSCDYNARSLDKKAGYIKATGGKATLKLSGIFTQPEDVQNHTVRIRAFDDAHHLSVGTAEYKIKVGPTVAGADPKNVREFENMTWSQPATQTAAFAVPHGGAASGGGYSAVFANQGTEASPVVNYYDFSVSTEAYYALGIRLITAPHLGKFRLALIDPGATSSSDDDLTTPIYDANGEDRLVIDSYSPTQSSRYVPIGEYLPDMKGVLLKKGRTYRLAVEIVGTSGVNFIYNGTYGGRQFTNWSNNGRSLALDSLTVAALRADFPNLQSSFNNFGIGAGKKFDLMNAGTTSISPTAFASVPGMAPVAAGGYTFTPGSDIAPFSIPAATTTGDNVVSSGQTIKLPAGTLTGSHVNLLVAATCGEINVSNAGLTITYKDPDVPGKDATIEPLLGRVPHWLDTSTPLATEEEPNIIPVHMGHYLDGATAVTSGNPRLYIVRFRIGLNFQNLPFVSVTLPRVGSTFTRAGCQTPGAKALHVFGMSLNEPLPEPTQ